MKPLNRKNYGSIPHLLGSKLGATDKYVHEGQHRIMTEKTRDKHDYVIVTEKYDGSNVGIAKVANKIIAITRSGYLAETSLYTQHHYFADWVKLQGNRFDFIGENERIAGEWMMCAHGIKYDVLKDPFIAFDYFTANNERMLHSDLISKTVSAEIETSRIIFQGHQAFRLDWALEELNGNKHLHTVIAHGKPEGLVYRVERKGKFDYVAKFVRQDHRCGIYIIDVAEADLTWNVNPNTFEKSKERGRAFLPLKTKDNMKTIEVTDEMHKFLMDLSKELNTQDHRGTRMPYFFQVQTKEQIAVPEGCGTEAWHYDGSLIETKEEIEEAVNEWKEWDEATTEFNNLEDYEIEEILESAGYSKVNYDYKDNLENAFLTSKACDEHIRVNKHNLKSPINYLSGSFRNPELETVMRFLCELTSGTLHT